MRFSFLRLALPRAAALWGVAVVGFGCSSDTTTAAAPAGPPTLAIDSLRPAGRPAVTKASLTDSVCVELGQDPAKTLTVVVAQDSGHPGQILNWLLEPPFSCDGTPQCGYLLVTIDPGAHAFHVASASVSIDVPMAQLESPEGTHTIRVELRNSDGSPFKDPSGKGAPVTVSVRVATRCDGSPLDAGADGALPPSNIDAATPDADAETPDGRAPDSSVSDASTREAAAPDSSAIPDATGRDASPD